MNTNRSLLLALGAFLVGLLTAGAREFPDEWFWDSKPENRTSHTALEGKAMPSLAGLSEWMNGGINASEVKGKVVVVDFYATWCGPCMAAIPKNNAMLKKHKARGLVLLGVCTSSRGQDKFAANAREHHVAYPVARDATEQVAKGWAVNYYPTYAVIDRKGIVRAVGLRPSRVEEVVKKLLAEPSA